MRAATAFVALTTLALLAVLNPLGAAPASADRAGDWRSQACESTRTGVRASDSYTMAAKVSERLEKLPTVTVTMERLAFDGGIQCDLLRLDGVLPYGTELRGHGGGAYVLSHLVIGGTSQGEMQVVGSTRTDVRSTRIRVLRHDVQSAMSYRPDDSGTVPVSPTLPEPWRGQPFTTTHTRTLFKAHVSGRVGTEKSFTVTPATRAAAARRLAADLEVAQNAVDRRAARTTYRLALRGIRLAWKPVRETWSGELAR